MRALGDLPPELRRQAIDVARRQSIVVRHKPADDEGESVDRRDLVGAAQDVDCRLGTPALLGVPEADKLFAQQLEAVGMVFDRLADKSDPLRCVVCRAGLALDATSAPAVIGWLKPISRDGMFVFALCYSCATDDSEDFHERFLAALAGKGARDIDAGTA